MSTLAEAKSALDYARTRLEAHNQTCSCRHKVKGRRPACAERAGIEAEARVLRGQIKTWFDMPEDAETLF